MGIISGPCNLGGVEMSELTGTCARCGRALKDPLSIKRSFGPVCFEKVGGNVFESDMDASAEEWAERERLLQNGGEIDYGSNWKYRMADGRVFSMRVSVRANGDDYEAYGRISAYRFLPGKECKGVYVEAGPMYTALADKRGQAGGARSSLCHG